MAQLAGIHACDSHDLGSNPRSHIFLMLFFYASFHAALIVKNTIFPHHQAIHVPNVHNHKAEDARNMLCPVNMPYKNLAKSMDFNVNGPEC